MNSYHLSTVKDLNLFGPFLAKLHILKALVKVEAKSQVFQTGWKIHVLLGKFRDEPVQLPQELGDFRWKMGFTPLKTDMELEITSLKRKIMFHHFPNLHFLDLNIRKIVLSEERCIMMHWWHDDVMK